MANIKNLKKDLNYVIGEIIEAVYIQELANGGKPTPASEAIIDEAIALFDSMVAKINAKNVENKKAHFKQINIEFENSANQLIEKINAL